MRPPVEPMPTSADAHFEREAQAQAMTLAAFERGAAAQARRIEHQREAIGLRLPPLASFPDYAELADKHREIATRKSELDRELSATDTAIARGLVSHRQRQVEQQAKAIIDGNAGEAFHGFEELRARQARLGDEARAYGEAIRMLRAQMDEIRAERSIDAVEIAAPHHRRAVAKLADACAALLSALREEELIRHMVTSEGYDARLPAFNVATPVPHLEQLAREYLG